MRYAKLRRNALTSALSIAMLSPLGAMAQDTTDQAPPVQPVPAQDESAKTLDKVTVTGSRIKRAEIEGPAPLTIITGDQLKAEGFVQVYDALTSLTEATGTVEADLQWGSHTPNASPLNLRNMGPGRSLLLVNGRRVADYPLPYGGQSNFANYGNIPTAAVDRIEILAGGASAIYGSDAVAGVVNVILKKGYEGNEVRVRGGAATEGGRDTWDLSWVGGKSGEQWNVTYALQGTYRRPIFGRDRPEMDHEDDAPRESWSPQQRIIGFNDSTGISLIDFNNGGQRLAPPTGACDRFNGEFRLSDRELLGSDYWNGNVTNQGTYCGKTHGAFSDWLLRGGNEDYSGYAYGTWDFDNGMQAWASVAVYDSEAYWGTSPPVGVLGAGGPDFDYAFFDPNYNTVMTGVRRFTPQEVGGVDNLWNHNQETSWDISAGLRGSIFNDRFDWEASLGRARYKIRESLAVIDFDRFNDFFMGPVLGEVDGLEIRELNQERWWNPITPEEYRQFSTHSINESSSYVNQANFILSGELFQGWAGPIGFAAVLEAAEQGYSLGPDPFGQQDYWVWNIDQGGGSRSRYAGGVELKVPLLESLTLTAAGRYDWYGDYKANDNLQRLEIGNQTETTWNAGLEWRPLQNLLVRGTYATSFDAPDMHFLLAQPSNNFVTDVDQLTCIQSDAHLPGSSPSCGETGSPHRYLMTRNRRGTPDLESETGKSWTVGFVWDVMDGLSLSADYWSVEIENIVTDINHGDLLFDEAGCITGETTDPNVPWASRTGLPCDVIYSRVIRNDDASNDIDRIEVGPVNLALRSTEGFDTSLKYRLQTDRWGDFRFGLNYTNIQSLHEQNRPTSPNPERRDRDIRSKVRGSVSWQGEKWNATVYGDRIGAVPGVRYHWNEERGGYGGCLPFADGYVPNDGDCTEPATLPNGDPNPNPNAGQSTQRYFGRVGPAIVWNFNVGYKLTENAKINFYVNNVFNATGYNHKDPYKRDYEFTNSRLWQPVGREIAMEYVFDF